MIDLISLRGNGWPEECLRLNGLSGDRGDEDGEVLIGAEDVWERPSGLAVLGEVCRRRGKKKIVREGSEKRRERKKDGYSEREERREGERREDVSSLSVSSYLSLFLFCFLLGFSLLFLLYIVPPRFTCIDTI